MGVDAVLQVGIVGDRFLAPQILQAEHQFVHHPQIVVQEGHAEGLIVVRMAHGHKFSPHLPARVKTTHTGTAHKDWIVDDLPVPKQLPQLLLEEVAHRSTCLSLIFAFEGSG